MTGDLQATPHGAQLGADGLEIGSLVGVLAPALLHDGGHAVGYVQVLQHLQLRSERCIE